jgi:parallel beta-helix repeat protein
MLYLKGNITGINATIDGIKGRIEDTNLSAIEKDVSYLRGNITGINDTIVGVIEHITVIDEICKQIDNVSNDRKDSGDLSWISDNVVFVSDEESNLTDVILKNKDKIIILDDGVYHTGGLNITADDVYIRSLRKWGAMLDADNASDGIFLETVNNVTLDSLAISNCTRAIYIENSTSCDIINNQLTEFKDIGLALKNSTHCNIILNNIDPSENHYKNKTGIKLNKTSDNNTLLFNDIALNKHDNLSCLYHIRLSKDNVIYISDDGYVREDDVTCYIKDSRKFNCSWTKNETLVDFEPLSKNMWEFLD